MSSLVISWKFEESIIEHDGAHVSSAGADELFCVLFEASVHLRGGTLNVSFPFEPMLTLLRGFHECVDEMKRGTDEATYSFLLESWHVYFTKSLSGMSTPAIVRVTADLGEGVCETTLADLDHSVRDATQRVVTDIVTRYPPLAGNRAFLKSMRKESFLSHIRLPVQPL